VHRAARIVLLAIFPVLALAVPARSAADVGGPVDVGIRPAHPAQWDHLSGNSATGVWMDLAVDDPSGSRFRAQVTMPVPRGWAASCHGLIFSEILARCRTSSRSFVATVQLPAPDSDNTFLLGVYPASTLPDGAVTNLHLHVAPVGTTDPDPSDNDLVAAVRMQGIADLSGALTQTATTAAVGDTVGFTLAISNAGPDPALAPGLELDGDGMTSGRVRLETPMAGCRVYNPDAGEGWTVLCQFLPSIRPGHTLRVEALWTVKRRNTGGVVHARFGEFSTDPDLPAKDVSALGLPLGIEQPELTSEPVSVVAAAPGPPVPPVPPLANTGVAATDELLVALLSIVVGAGLLVAEARTRRRTPVTVARGRPLVMTR
jgi:hypothetical protein